MPSNGTKQRTVKIDPDTHDKLTSLITGIKQHGWASIGNSSRTETATIANVIDEALLLLLARRDATTARQRRA